MSVQAIKVPPQLALVLNSAGDKSGVDFEYLLQTAMRESSLNPKAKASTSSATGLFQFLKDTWLDVMKSDGARLGYKNYADAIHPDGQGGFSIPDKALQAEVLALREDPAIAADMAAAFTRNNGAYLKQRFGRQPSPGELYIAHFLGAQGAARLFEAGLENPDQIAAQLFPRQAAANKAIFYSGGKARSIKQVYQALVAKHVPGATSTTNAANAQFAAQQLAAASQPEPVRLPLEMSFENFYSPLPVDAAQSPVITPQRSGPLFRNFYSN